MGITVTTRAGAGPSGTPRDQTRILHNARDSMLYYKAALCEKRLVTETMGDAAAGAHVGI